MRLTCLTSTLLAIAAAAGLSNDGVAQNPDRPVVEVDAGKPRPKTGSLLLAVRVDASGVHVLQVVRKPDLEFIAPKRSDRARFRWTMKDARGEAIADGGFEVRRIDLDPQRAGQPARVERGRVVSTEVFTIVKVPAHADFSSIEFARDERGARVAMGSARAASLQVR